MEDDNFKNMQDRKDIVLESDVDGNDVKKDNENMYSKIVFPEYTVIGALAKYISTPNSKFQPMNANFGILPQLQGKKIKDKKERYKKLAERSLEKLNYRLQLDYTNIKKM